jgi:Flp pilus assembly protein TadD
VELEPNDPFSYTALSVACMRGGRIAEAEDALARSRTLQGG